MTKWKVYGAIINYLVVSYPERIRRVVRLLLFPISKSNRVKTLVRIRHLGDYFLHLIFGLSDLLAVPELYNCFMGIVKYKTRALTIEECQAIREIYGDTLPLQSILIDPSAYLWTRHLHIAYVSHYTINYWQKLSKAVLIHECLHVYQYLQLGSVYIYECLKAQASAEGYDYGGIDNLMQHMMFGGRLEAFNYEQQAEILEDAYRWYAKTGDIPSVYQYYMNQLEGYLR